MIPSAVKMKEKCSKSDLQVMETSKTIVLGPEHPFTLTNTGTCLLESATFDLTTCE
jgi:hypothetical protein